MWKPLEVDAVGRPLRVQPGPDSSGGALPSPEPPRRCTKLKCGLAMCLFLVLLVCITALVVTFTPATRPLGNGPCQSQCPKCRKGVRLPPAEPLPTPDLSRKSDPWYITSNMGSKPLSYDAAEGALRVDYIPGLWGSANGAEFKANPRQALPADSAVLSYSVYFPKDFPWQRGGKLPGFCVSDEPGSGCATGSEWAWGAGSFRMMWREGGRAIGYTYLPLQSGFVGARWSAWAAQGGDYKRVSIDTGSTGDDVFCKVDGGLWLKAGQWNEVTMVIAMNTPGLANGWLSMSVNGETRTVKDVRWRGLSSKVQVTSVLFATFFGGGDKSWAVKEETYAMFKDFKVTAPADLKASDL